MCRLVVDQRRGDRSLVGWKRGTVFVTLSAFAASVLLLPVPALAHPPFCVETVNPHGENVPPAGSTTLPGPRGGQNEDGFYRVGTNGTADVFLVDAGSGFAFGCFPNGTNIKYTQAPGATPGVKKIGSDNGEAGAVAAHLTGTGDLLVYEASSSCGTNPAPVGTPVSCLVPPPPK